MAKTIQAILNLKDNFSNTLKNTTSQTQKFQRQMQHTNNTIKEMQSAVIGSVGRFVGGLGLLEIGKQSIELASNLAEVQNVVDVTFGGSADTINNWSKSALKSFGLSELQAKKFNGTMGALIKSSGISGDKMVEMSTNLTGLSADFASFYNLDSAEAFDKIKAGISGETEPLRALGINMSVANLEAFALTQGINKQWKEMSQAEQVQLRYNYLMIASKDAQGDFARTSKGFANQLRIAQENLKQLGATLGALVLPFLNNLLIRFNDIMDVIPKFATGFQNAISSIMSGGDPGEIFTLLEENITDFLYNNLPEKVATFFDGATYMINSFVYETITNLMRIGTDLVEPFKSTFNSIYSFVLNVGNSIGQTFIAVGKQIDLTTPFNIIRDVIAGFLSDIQGIFDFFNNNWSTISPIIMGVAGAILFFNGALKTIEVTMTIVKAVQEAWAVVTGACNIAMMLLNGTLTLTPLGWITILIGGLIAIGVALYQNWDVICAKASELWATITTAFDGIGQSISAVWESTKSSFSGFLNYCIDGLNSLIEGFNSLGGTTIPDWVPGVGGQSFSLNIPTIPHFATGTQYFTGGLARINERSGELVNLPDGSQVIPADKTDKLLNGSGGTTVQVIVQGNVIGNHEFVNEMGQIITNKLKLALVNN